MDAAKTGTLIAQARKEKNLTQKDLAQNLHVSIQAVSKWERGLNFPDIALLEPLAEQLGLTVSELLAGERNAPAGEDLVRSSLRVSLAQLFPRVRRWRKVAALAISLLLVMAGILGYLYVQRNTTWLPQNTTVVTPREATDYEILAAKIAGSRSRVYLFDITYADGLYDERLQLELWTHEGLVKTWELAYASDFPGAFPRSHTIGIGHDIQWGQDGQPNLFHYGAALRAGIWSGTLDDVPYLDGGFGFSPMSQEAVVDPEHGVVLGCFSLDPTGTGRWRAPGWAGNVVAPTVDPGEAFLLLRMTVH